MNYKLKSSALAAILATSFASSASAASLVSWDFDPLTGGAGNFGPSPFAGTVLSSITSSGLVRGSGIGSTTNSGATNAWGGNDFTIAAPSFAVALAAQEFATFTVAADPGFVFSVSDFSAHNIRRSSSGPTQGQWQYSLDGNSFVDIGTPITWGAVTSSAGNAQPSLSLSGVSALQSISSVTFRVVTWGATTVGGTWYFNDPTGTVGADFTVNGTVSAIPEPSAFAALFGGMALVGTLAVRRRRSQG